ncbi:hypothetical protein JW935_13945 [candidate division KSB1 bacterium]|nr:hypothetical protein [candidate division KSB1 bacterium]
MKRVYITIGIIFIIATMTFAAIPVQQKIDKALDNYIVALKSDNAGLRSSAAYQIVKMKSRYPQADYSKVEAVLNRIAHRDQSDLLRVQAELTLIYVRNTELAYRVKAQDPSNPWPFYNRLNNELFAANVVK